MVSKTQEQINQDIIRDIQSLRPDVDVSSGNLVNDVVVQPPSIALGLAYQELDNIRHSHSISYVSSLSDAQVDELANNYGLVRKQATPSQGYITFFRKTEPPSTITVIQGTLISSQQSSSNITHSFVTLSTGIMDSSSYNIQTGMWEVTVPVESINNGTTENVAANTITIFSGISGIDGCTNRTALTNATDIETNAQLALRITTAAQARLLGTKPGYENLVNQIDNVEKVKVVPPGNESLRMANGNEVDIIIQGQDIESASQIEIFDSVNGLCIFLESLPVIGISSVFSSTSTFIEGTDFAFVEDTNSEKYGSVESLDKLVWLSDGDKPSNGDQYTISYQYNKLIQDIQNTINDEDNNIMASDVLIREVSTVLVDISMSVAVTASAPYDAVNQIETYIAEYIDSLNMGDPLEMSDVDFYLRTNVSWIDRIILPFTNISRRGSTGQTDLMASKYELFTIDDNSLSITII